MRITPLFVAAAAAALFVVLAPGLLASYAVGLRGIAAWAFGPAITTSIVGLGGALSPMLGLSWSPAVYAGWTVLTLVIAYAVGRLLRRGSPPQSDHGNARRGAVTGAVLGGIFVFVAMAWSIGRLTAVPAQPDVNYHLNEIRHMLVTGDISSLHAGGFSSGSATGFYPATFHGLAVSTIQLMAGLGAVQPVVAANLLSLVLGCVVWTSGCVLLVRQVFGRRGPALVIGGVASASFTAMPFWLAGYGTLWPNLAGLAVVPALVAALLSVFGLAQDDLIGRPRAWAAGIAVLLGLSFVHPNSVTTVVLIGYVLLVVQAIRWLVRSRARHRLGSVLVVLALVGPPVLWLAAQSIPRVAAVAAYAKGPPEESVGQALIESLLNSQRFGAPVWMTSAVVVVGLISLLRPGGDRRRLWLPVLYLVTVAIFVGLEAFQGPFRLITGFWYNNSPRLAAIIPVPGVLVLTEGLLVVSALARRLIRRRWRAATSLGVTGAVLVAYVVLSLGNNVGAHVGRLKPFYYPHDAEAALLPPDGVRALEVLGRQIPPDAITLANPWRGGALLYAFTGRRVAIPTEKSITSPEREVVQGRIELAANPADPQVCPAVRTLGIGYVLTGGSNFLPNTGKRAAFLGVDRVPGRPGFALVAQSGPYRLWRITACG